MTSENIEIPSGVPDPEQIPATEQSKQEFARLASALVVDGKIVLQRAFKRATYALEDGRLLEIEKRRPFTEIESEEGMPRGTETQLDEMIPKSIQVSLRHSIGDEMVEVEGYKLLEASRQFDRKFSKNRGKLDRKNTEKDGKMIMDALNGDQDAIRKLRSLAATKKNENMVMALGALQGDQKAIEKIRSLAATEQEARGLGIFVTTEAEASRINALLKYVADNPERKMVEG
jgi:hypothetical protein